MEDKSWTMSDETFVLPGSSGIDIHISPCFLQKKSQSFLRLLDFYSSYFWDGGNPHISAIQSPKNLDNCNIKYQILALH